MCVCLADSIHQTQPENKHTPEGRARVKLNTKDWGFHNQLGQEEQPVQPWTAELLREGGGAGDPLLTLLPLTSDTWHLDLDLDLDLDLTPDTWTWDWTWHLDLDLDPDPRPGWQRQVKVICWISNNKTCIAGNARVFHKLIWKYLLSKVKIKCVHLYIYIFLLKESRDSIK